MRVHLVKEKVIQDFVAKHAISKNAFGAWLRILKSADWEVLEHVQETFPATDILGRGCKRLVFDVGGNKYRLICSYMFGQKNIHFFICWIGTHAEYTKICNKGSQYTVNEF